jgi:ferredoxin-type protein NapH
MSPRGGGSTTVDISGNRRISKEHPGRIDSEVKVLKVLLFIYILFGLLVAGANFGWAPNASPRIQAAILAVWQFYENQLKTVLIIVCAVLTLRVVKKREIPRLRRYNLIGLISAAFVLHIAGPLLSGNPDLYFVGMPLPWSTVGLRLAVRDSSFYQDHLPSWGQGGITLALVVFAVSHVIVLGGTLLMGRRWQCSTICLFNGFASEVFAPAFPLFGKKRRLGRGLLGFFTVMRWLLLGIALALTVFWLIILIFGLRPTVMYLLETLETYKYLVVELLLALFFWTVLIGRGYCYYCPLGTVLGWVGRAVGQKIVTRSDRCIGCGKCDNVCPLSIRIKDRALEGQAVVDTRCVGCGHCVDACPVQALAYSTGFLKRIGRV